MNRIELAIVIGRLEILLSDNKEAQISIFYLKNAIIQNATQKKFASILRRLEIEFYDNHAVLSELYRFRNFLLEADFEKAKIGIDELGLSTRVYNALYNSRRYRIRTIGDIIQLCEDDLLKIKNLGEKGLDELYEKLRAVGIETDLLY